MENTFRQARRSGVKLMIGLAGPSGSGKTYSALLLAKGIQEVDGGKVFFIDTENRRSEHYADSFDFQIGELTAPFNPDRYLNLINEAVKAGAKIVVVDSASHMHEGEGGILDMAEKFLDRVAGNDEGKRDKNKMRAWIKPKAELGRVVNRLLQIDAHFIFCFRAQEKVKPLKDGNGKTKPTSIGIQPIASDRLSYEMTMRLVLPGNEKGVPDLSAQATKLPEPLIPMMKRGMRITSDVGAMLAKWARGVDSKAAAEVRPIADHTQPRQIQEKPAPAVTLPAAGASAALVAYRKEMGSSLDEEDLKARHEGSENFQQIAGAETAIARGIYGLNLRRVRGAMEPEAFNAEILKLFAVEPA